MSQYSWKKSTTTICKRSSLFNIIRSSDGSQARPQDSRLCRVIFFKTSGQMQIWSSAIALASRLRWWKKFTRCHSQLRKVLGLSQCQKGYPMLRKSNHRPHHKRRFIGNSSHQSNYSCPGVKPQSTCKERSLIQSMFRPKHRRRKNNSEVQKRCIELRRLIKNLSLI